MADWYISSTAYAAIAAFVPSAVYSVGNIVKPTAPASQTRWVFRCTTAGTASTEPAWPTGNNATVTTGGATFTNVTGQSTYFWAAAAGDHQTLNGSGGTVRFAVGDRVFISSDHTETVASNQCGAGGTIAASFGLVQFVCVNRAGSTPPAAADVTTGATISANTTMYLPGRVNTHWTGVSFNTTNTSPIQFSGPSAVVEKTAYFRNCTFFLNFASGSAVYNSNGQKVVFDNTTLQFGHVGQNITFSNSELIWINTPSAIAGAIFPTTLFNASGSGQQNTVTLRGVDLSAVAGTLVTNTGIIANRYIFDSCRIASAVTRYVSSTNTQDIIELVSCYNGTSILNESYQPAGAVTTETTITLSGGATDNVGTFSHKMVSNANADKYANPLNGFWMDTNYATTGSSKTATVEIVSSASLNNDEISLVLEYLGTASSSLASMTTSLPATVLTTPSAVTSSSATWNSLPATPVRQHLQVTFTPQTAGRVRAQVRLGKASTTCYYDPRVVVT